MTTRNKTTKINRVGDQSTGNKVKRKSICLQSGAICLPPEIRESMCT
jgi:hypothetical protein